MFSKKSTLASPQLRKRKRRLLIIKLSAALILIALALWGLAALARLHAITIGTIETEGSSLVDPHQIQGAAESDLQGNYLLIFPKRNFLLYPKSKIKSDIEKEFPAFSSVNVWLENFHTLKITVTERKAAAVWCAYDEALTDPFTDTCYLMDENGFIYFPAPQFKGNAYMRYYGLVSGSPIGQSYLPGKLAGFETFLEGVKEIGLSPVSIYAHGDDYDVNLASGGKLILNSESDLPSELVNLDSIIQDNIHPPEDPETAIDYVDLRYGNRVFFKLND